SRLVRIEEHHISPLHKTLRNNVLETVLHKTLRSPLLQNEQPEDVGVVIEDVELLNNLRSISCEVMLFGLIYALNLSYTSELKFIFEFFQKVLMNLDGNKLSPKVQTLKIKMLQ
uniref:Uncharacterized protein n=1 Tax=Mastacembelus armatus TaxID=205130 RepID=A0A7N8YE98_9TELE